MTKWLCGLLAVALVGGITLAPVAAKPKKEDGKKPDLKEVFKKKDKDGDDKLSEEEFVGKRKDEEAKAKAKKQFARKDKDGDGFLTLEEFTAPPKKKKKKAES